MPWNSLVGLMVGRSLGYPLQVVGPKGYVAMGWYGGDSPHLAIPLWGLVNRQGWRKRSKFVCTRQGAADQTVGSSPRKLGWPIGCSGALWVALSLVLRVRDRYRLGRQPVT